MMIIVDMNNGYNGYNDNNGYTDKSWKLMIINDTGWIRLKMVDNNGWWPRIIDG